MQRRVHSSLDGLLLQSLLHSAQEKGGKIIAVTLLEAMAAWCKHCLKAYFTTFRLFGVNFFHLYIPCTPPLV